MKPHKLGFLSLAAMAPFALVSCDEISISTKAQKELGYLDSAGKPNLELKLALSDGKVFKINGFKPIQNFIEGSKIKNADIESFVTKNLKITEKFDTLKEEFEDIKFEADKNEDSRTKITKEDKLEFKQGTVMVKFMQDKTSFGKKRLALKDFAIEADQIKKDIFDKIKVEDITITSIDKPKAEFEAKFNEKSDLGKLLIDFEKITTAKFVIEFVSATNASGNAKTDTDKLSKGDKVIVKISIKDLTKAQSIEINDVVIA